MDVSKIIFREMTKEDVPEVARHEHELFTDPWPESIFHEDIGSPYSHPVVAQIDNEIVGYAVIWIGVEEGHLTNLGVARKFQRKSIAKKLLAFILQLAEEMGLAQIILEVRPSNAPAVLLYEAFGFEKLAVRKNYYRRPVEDCLVMRKKLNRSLPEMTE